MPAPSPTAAPSPIGKRSTSSSLCAHLLNRTRPPRLPRHGYGGERSPQSNAAPKPGAVGVRILTRAALRGCGCRGSQRCPPLLLRARCVIPGRLRSISAPEAERLRSVLESLDRGAGNGDSFRLKVEKKGEKRRKNLSLFPNGGKTTEGRAPELLLSWRRNHRSDSKALTTRT